MLEYGLWCLIKFSEKKKKVPNMSKRQLRRQSFTKTLLIPTFPGSFCNPILLKHWLFLFHIAAVCKTQIQSDRLTPDVGWSSHSIEASGFTCPWAPRCPVPYVSVRINHKTSLTAPERTVVYSNVSTHPQNTDQSQYRASELAAQS